MMPRLVAIIPAAGHSRRMGQPKLLLEVAGQSVIARVIEALRQGGVLRCLVVVRSSDDALVREATTAGAEVVIPSPDPGDMRQSVESALRHLGNTVDPCEGWVLVPADHPTLNPRLVQELIAAWSASPQLIAVPVFEGQRGHPTIFPWRLEEDVLALSPDQGLNHVLRSDSRRVLEVSVTDRRVLDDLDTPEDWQRVLRELAGRPERDHFD